MFSLKRLEKMANTDSAPPRDKRQPRPSKAGAGPDNDAGRTKTETEKNLRRVQGQYDPDIVSFKEENAR